MRTGRILLALLVPGHRLLRHGHKRAALALQVALVAALLAVCVTPWLRSALGLATFLALLAAFGAISFTRGRPGAPTALSRPEWAFLIAPQCAFLAIVLVPALRREALGIEVYRAATASMTPTLCRDDRFVVATRGGPPRVGDLVVFRPPDDTARSYVKRVAGLGGDEVAGVLVPPGHAFVLGDNAENSRDSRHFGPIPIASITGRALYVVWADRWTRIGTSLDSAASRAR